MMRNSTQSRAIGCRSVLMYRDSHTQGNTVQTVELALHIFCSADDGKLKFQARRCITPNTTAVAVAPMMNDNLYDWVNRGSDTQNLGGTDLS